MEHIRLSGKFYGKEISAKSENFRLGLLTHLDLLIMTRAQLEFRRRTDIVAIEFPE